MGIEIVRGIEASSTIRVSITKTVLRLGGCTYFSIGYNSRPRADLPCHCEAFPKPHSLLEVGRAHRIFLSQSHYLDC